MNYDANSPRTAKTRQWLEIIALRVSEWPKTPKPDVWIEDHVSEPGTAVCYFADQIPDAESARPYDLRCGRHTDKSAIQTDPRPAAAKLTHYRGGRRLLRFFGHDCFGDQ